MARQDAETIKAKRKRQRKAARSAVKKAPGDLEIVRAFVSTVPRGKRGDELATPERLGRWFEQRGLLDAGVALGNEELRRALGLRRGLRALTLANSGVEADAERLERIAETAAAGRFALRFEAGIPVDIALAPLRRRSRGDRGNRPDGEARGLVAAAEDLRREGLRPRLLRHLAESHRRLVRTTVWREVPGRPPPPRPAHLVNRRVSPPAAGPGRVYLGAPPEPSPPQKRRVSIASSTMASGSTPRITASRFFRLPAGPK